MFLEDLQAIAKKALAFGGSMPRPQVVAWDVSGNCTAPVERELRARPTRRSYHPVEFREVLRRSVGSIEETWDSPVRLSRSVAVRAQVERYATPTLLRGAPLWVDLTVRCRRCEKCLYVRRMMWTHRAKAEVAAAARTWFGTLTLKPEEQYKALCRATAKSAARSVDFESLSHGEQFDARHRAISPLLTLWFKRVRKSSDALLRYMLVAEAHKSGLPHYHVLMHEVDANRPVRHAELVGQWPHGFSKFNLLTDQDLRAVHYATKYLSKSNDARVRASLGYGQNMPSIEDSDSVKIDPRKIPILSRTEHAKV